MNKAMLTVGIIILAMFSLVLINIISSASSGSELDFYLVKETAQAAMIDAVDVSFMRSDHSAIRMDKEKFVESFIRRFAESVAGDRNYEISFYDINETPPKVSVKVGSSTVLSFDGTDAEITTYVDSILETNNTKDEYSDFMIDVEKSDSLNLE